MAGLRESRAAWARWKAAWRRVLRLPFAQQQEVHAAIREGRAVREPELAAVVVELADQQMAVLSGGVRSPAGVCFAATAGVFYAVAVPLRWLISGDLMSALVAAGYFPIFLLLLGLLALHLGERQRDRVARAAELNRPLADAQEAEARERSAAEADRLSSRSLEQRLSDLDAKLARWRDGIDPS